MLTVTDAAANHLQEILDQTKERTEVADDAAIRLEILDDGEYGLTLDRERAGDSRALCDGRTVLLWDDQIEEVLGEQTLDVVETPRGETLAIR